MFAGYFEVNKSALLYNHSRVQTLTDPPPLPPKATITFELPHEVTIVHLTPPDSQSHQLLSTSYDIMLFNRIKDYFDRFYTSTNAFQVTLDSIDVILNSKLEEQFGVTDSLFLKQFSGLQEMKVCVK